MQPLVPVLASFIAGIIVSGAFAPSYEAAYALLAVSALAPVSAYLLGFRFSRLTVCIPFFFLGVLFILPYVRPVLPQNHVKNLIPKDGQLPASLRKAQFTDIEGVIRGAGEFSGGNVRYLVDAKRVNDGGQWKDAVGAVLLTVPVDRDAARFDAGDTVRFLARLKEPFNYGNPGEYDYKWRMNSKGIYATAFVKNERMIIRTGQGQAGVFSYPAMLRGRIRAFLDSTDGANAEPLKALIIAEKGGIAPDVKEAFVKTGTAHILAISGLHVGMVALFSYAVISLIMKRSERLLLALNRRKAALTLSLVPVMGYGLLAGFPVSTRRAVIMAAAFVFTMLLNRGSDMLNVLALAALIILAIEPPALWDISFQLTFAAVLAMVYVIPRLSEFFRGEDAAGKSPEGAGWTGRLVSKLRGCLIPAALATIAATLGTSPLLAYHFNRVSVTGVAANLIAVPITGVIVPLLLVAAVSLPFSEGLAGVAVYFADKIFSLLVIVVKFFAGLPYSALWVSKPTIFEMVLFYLLIIFAVNIKRARVYRFLAALIILALIVDAGYWALRARWSKELKVTFLSVGQGESSVVELPGGKVMLIDGGGLYGTDFDTGERLVAPFLRHEKIDTVDYMVLSHAQRDHMAGLKFIAENFRIGEFWWNGDGELGELEDSLERAGAAIRVLSRGAGDININGVRAEVLNPSGGSTAGGATPFDQNNNCLVLKLTYGTKSFLFTGDIGFPAEEELAKENIRAAVLKAPHHGSRYSSSVEFLNRVHPSIVVASAGRGNVFGFPHADALERYAAIKAKVYRTDRDGAVTVATDGANLNASTYLTEMPP